MFGFEILTHKEPIEFGYQNSYQLYLCRCGLSQNIREFGALMVDVMHDISCHQIDIRKFNSRIGHFDLRITIVVSERIAISIHQNFLFAEGLG